MKKGIIAICVAAIATLMVSTATAVPAIDNSVVENLSENEETDVPVKQSILDTINELISYLRDSAIVLTGVVIAPFYAIYLIAIQLIAFTISLGTEFINGLMAIFSGEPAL